VLKTLHRFLKGYSMRNLFMEDFKNVRKEVLALKQSYQRGLDRFNCSVAEATCTFQQKPISSREFRLTVRFITSSNNEPFNILNELSRMTITGRVWEGNTKTLVMIGFVLLPSQLEYTFKIISTAPILYMSAEDIEE